MGSYAECWLGPFYVGSTKNDIDPAIMQLFRSSDKHIISGPKKKIPLTLRRWFENIDNEEVIDVVFYSAPVNIIRDRLDLKGYTLETSKTAFMKWLNKEIQHFNTFATYWLETDWETG